MGDAAADRHHAHEDRFRDLDDRLSEVEGWQGRVEYWRAGNGEPHRGAESRITVLEREAVMVKDVDKIVAAALKQHSRSAAAVAKSALPWVALIAWVIVYVATGGKVPVPG